MPTSPKASGAMSKHMTQAERAAREAAERELMPQRAEGLDKPPRSMSKDIQAKKYWTATVERLEGTSLLDTLDRDTLAIYCTMLSRRDEMDRLCRQLIRETKKASSDAEALLETMSKLDTLVGKLQSQEKTILQYADKLGFTPAGRVRLAQKRAQAAAEVDPDVDLFGD